MVASFDKFNRYETPVLTLCNPDRAEVGPLGFFSDLNVTLNFNAVSEISFRYPCKDANGRENPFYDELSVRRVISCEELGFFIIQGEEEVSDGVQRYKEISASSAEIELSYKKVNLLSGTYQFYNPLSPTKTLLGGLLEKAPNWSVGYIDPDLMTKFRTFDISDGINYNFMMTDVEEAYDCNFVFDTVARKVSAYTPRSIVKNTDIYLTYHNLIKDVKVTAETDSLISVLRCYGGGELDITTVNPLGTAEIFNYDYFKPQMQKGLRDALNQWESKIESNRGAYKTALVNLKNSNSSLISERSKLTTLEGEYTAIEEVQAAQIQAGVDKSDKSAYQDTLNKLSAKQKEINASKSAISRYESQVSFYTKTLNDIHNVLKISNNLTPAQILELDNFRYEDIYQDDCFVKTSVMTEVEIQEMAQELYDQSVSLLKKLSEPKYSFSLSSVNFLFQHDFMPFIQQLELGALVHVEMYEDHFMSPVLLSVSFNYDSPDDFEMTFANRYRLNSATWQFSDLYDTATKTGSSLNFNYTAIKDFGQYQGDLVDFMNNSLDLTKNSLMNSSSLEMIMNQNGLRAKKLNSDGTYSGNQMWLTQNTLAFSRDGFNTVETALGAITLPDGSIVYGINAGVLLGKLIFGSNMTISNDNNSILMDANGFTMTTNNNKGRILMHPSTGIKIQTNNGSGWKDKFYVDANGNAMFEGTLKASEGTIGGFTIGANYLKSSNGVINLKSDGTGKMGLMSWTTTSATFNGNIYAKNLDYRGITSDKIASGEIDTRTIEDDAVTPAKLDRVYATEAEFDRLSTKVATIDEAYVNKATFNSLKASVADLGEVVAQKLDVDNLSSAISRLTLVSAKSIGVSNNLSVGGSFIMYGNRITTTRIRVVTNVYQSKDENGNVIDIDPVRKNIYYLTYNEEGI